MLTGAPASMARSQTLKNEKMIAAKTRTKTPMMRKTS